MAFVDKITNLETVQPNSLAGFANVSNSFCHRFPGSRLGGFRPGQRFQGASDNVPRRLITTGAKLGRDQFLAARAETERLTHFYFKLKPKRFPVATPVWRQPTWRRRAPCFWRSSAGSTDRRGTNWLGCRGPRNSDRRRRP